MQRPTITIQPSEEAMQAIAAVNDKDKVQDAAAAWLQALVARLQSQVAGIEVVTPHERTRAVTGRRTERTYAVMYALSKATDTEGHIVPVYSAIVHRVLLSASQAPSIQAYILDNADESGTPIVSEYIATTSGILSVLTKEGLVRSHGLHQGVDAYTGDRVGGQPARYYSITDKGRQALAAGDTMLRADVIECIDNCMAETIALCAPAIAGVMGSAYNDTGKPENLPHD